ncbi:MAG: hypothetical protein Q7R49_06080 [Candidatus Daviesbacteria bacterium]|nr:hypothetical protein [Candidatus Daviesbacteria bacterium]
MKNLLIYINPRKDFDDESKIAIKIQIDNSLDLGWKREDIMLVTNFPYEYNGVIALQSGDENYCPYFPPASKICTIVELFEKGFIEKGQIYWFHDLDVFQNEAITEAEIISELSTAEFGLTDKGRMPQWNTGTIFFKGSASDIFRMIKELSRKYETNEEFALRAITTNNILWATVRSALNNDQIILADIPGAENCDKRVKKINISYNLRPWNIDSTYRMAIKPIRAVQFHPLEARPCISGVTPLEFFMYGKNKINTVLMPERLIKIFIQHGIK